MISMLLHPETKTGEALDYGVVTSPYGRKVSSLTGNGNAISPEAQAKLELFHAAAQETVGAAYNNAPAQADNKNGQTDNKKTVGGRREVCGGGWLLH